MVAPLLVLAGLSGGALAQDKAKPPDKPRRIDQFDGMTSQILLDMNSKLNLSEDQKAKIVELKNSFEQKHKDVLRSMRQDVAKVRQAVQKAEKSSDLSAKQKANRQAKELRQAAEKLRVEFEKELLEILTESQRQEYQKIKKDLTKQAAQRPGKKPPVLEKKQDTDKNK